MGAIKRTKYLPLTSAGGTFTIDLTEMVERYTITIAAPVTLAANVIISADADRAKAPVAGVAVSVYLPGGITIGGYSITIFGYTITAAQALAPLRIDLTWNAATSAWVPMLWVSLTSDGVIDNAKLIDASITLDKLEPLANNSMIAGDGSNRPKAVTIGGVLSAVYTAGVMVFSFAAGSIYDAAINAAAAITRTKLKSGTAGYVVYNDDSTGAMTEEQYVAKKRGGFGESVAAANGFPSFDSGSLTLAPFITAADSQDISFETDGQGPYYIYFPKALRVTGVRVRVKTTIGANDDGILVFQDSRGNVMEGDNIYSGYMAITANAAQGEGFTSSITANNTFADDDYMMITSSKPTAGGTIYLQVITSRNH